jgi:hypothetical protein
MNSPQDPLQLFNQHRLSLSDDCEYRLRQRYDLATPSSIQIQDLLLLDLSTLLEQAGKSLSDFHLPLPTGSLNDLNNTVCRTISEEQQYDHDILQQHWSGGYSTANTDQKKILDKISSAVDNHENDSTRGDLNNGTMFFIDGPGGTGKTFVENLLLSYVRGSGQIALAVASSGIASILLEGGRTSHSRFKIPIDIHDDSKCNIAAQSDLAALIKVTKLIIWDEAPAQHRFCFEAVDRSFQDIRQNHQPFGEIVMVFAGTTLFLRLLITFR